MRPSTRHSKRGLGSKATSPPPPLFFSFSPPRASDTPSCEGWGSQATWEGVNWYRQLRPSAAFVSSQHLEQSTVFKTIQQNGEKESFHVVVQWRSNARAHVTALFDTPAWAWLVLVTLLWPLALTLLWTIVTLGSCVFVSRYVWVVRGLCVRECV